MLKNSKGPELPAWVFLALRLGALLLVAVVAVLMARCNEEPAQASKAVNQYSVCILIYC